MNIEYIKENGREPAVVSGSEKLIHDARSALDLAMTIRYETGADRIIIDKKAVCEDFFILSTGLAGEILQKFINYHVKAATAFGASTTYHLPCGAPDAAAAF